MIFDPPQYEWEAANVREAKEYLQAVERMIDAHMASLAPGAQGRMERERHTPIKLTLTLDLGPLVECINDRRTVEAIAADLELE
ncbi:hypothetical protein ACJ6WE_09030 [Streptomyces sp. MMS24-I31]|uniref:hypothetical protein n=1 Tax=Streptomyces sp. MMS24-I31 TaxID=3351563 RepID=UPI003896A889